MTAHRRNIRIGRLHLAQSIVDFTPLINALKDAGITGYLLFGLIVGGLVYLIQRARLRNENTAVTSNAAVMTSLSNAITTLTTNITTITQAMQEMQTGARKRDLQFDKMNDIQEQQNKATGEQNKLLKDVNASVNDLKKSTESGHDFTKRLIDSVVDGSKDTAAAVLGLDKRIEDHTQTLQSRLDEIDKSLNNLPVNVVKAINWDDVLPRIKVAVGEIVEVALKECIDENAKLAKELDCADSAIDDTKQKLEEAERAKVIGVIVPAPAEPKPSEESAA